MNKVWMCSQFVIINVYLHKQDNDAPPPAALLCSYKETSSKGEKIYYKLLFVV